MTKFAITQAQFDVAFAAGVADAAHLKSTVNDDLYQALLPLSGQVADVAAAQWEEMRHAFVEGQAYEHVIDVASAAKRWTRLIDAFDLTKPQTVAAAAKAAQRARAKDKGQVASKATISTGREAVVMVAEGDKTVSESARLSACIELLKHMDANALVKAQAVLLTLVETTEADSAVM